MIASSWLGRQGPSGRYFPLTSSRIRRKIVAAASEATAPCHGDMATNRRVKTSRDLEFRPLTPQRWADFEALFGERGAFAGCWCMWWRLKRSEFDRRSGKQKKRAMRSIVDSGEIPGLLAYVEVKPAGWCSVAPRERFGPLERSRTLKRVDDQPVWSVVCFFIGEPYRARGLMRDLLRAAVDYAVEQGASIVEGYPREANGRLPGGTEAFVGIASVFRAAGFVEVLRRSASRPIMRYSVKCRLTPTE